MKRKALAVMMAMTMVLAMAGCGSKPAEKPAETTEAATEEATTEEAAEEAAVEEPAVEEAAPEETAEAVETMSYADFLAAEVDDPVVVDTFVQAKQSWWNDSATIYTQTPEGAYFVYGMACSQEDYDLLVPGTEIIVTGYKGEWSGELEIVDATFVIKEGGESFIAEAADVTELLGTDDLIAHQNELVSFKGMTVEASTDPDGNEVAYLYNWDGSGSQGDDLYFNVSVNGATYSFTVESYLCDASTEVYQAVENLAIGDVVDLEGFLYWYEGANPHITKVTAAA